MVHRNDKYKKSIFILKCMFVAVMCKNQLRNISIVATPMSIRAIQIWEIGNEFIKLKFLDNIRCFTN